MVKGDDDLERGRETCTHHGRLLHDESEGIWFLLLFVSLTTEVLARP